MAAVVGSEVGPEENVRAFGEYLDGIGLPVERVLGGLVTPEGCLTAEVGDVVSFFYAGMPDRFKVGPSPDGRH